MAHDTLLARCWKRCCCGAMTCRAVVVLFSTMWALASMSQGSAEDVADSIEGRASRRTTELPAWVSALNNAECEKDCPGMQEAAVEMLQVAIPHMSDLPKLFATLSNLTCEKHEDKMYCASDANAERCQPSEKDHSWELIALGSCACRCPGLQTTFLSEQALSLTDKEKADEYCGADDFKPAATCLVEEARCPEDAIGPYLRFPALCAMNKPGREGCFQDDGDLPCDTDGWKACSSAARENKRPGEACCDELKDFTSCLTDCDIKHRLVFELPTQHARDQMRAACPDYESMPSEEDARSILGILNTTRPNTTAITTTTATTTIKTTPKPDDVSSAPGSAVGVVIAALVATPIAIAMFDALSA